MKLDTYKCDVCDRQKKDANHWFKGSKVTQDGNPAGVLVAQWDTCFRLPNVPETQTVRDFFDADEIVHLCGADCVMQWVSRNLH